MQLRKIRRYRYTALSKRVSVISRLLRRMSWVVSLGIEKTGLTANQVTWFRFILFVPCSTTAFAIGSYITNVIGVIALNLFNFFDYVDGDVARMSNQSSVLGEWLEHMLDKVGYLLIFGGLAFHQLAYGHVRVVDIAFIVSALLGSVVVDLLEIGMHQHFGLFFGTDDIYIENLKREGLPITKRILTSVMLCHRQQYKVLFFPIYAITILGLVNHIQLVFPVVAIATVVRGIILFWFTLGALQGREKPPYIRLLGALRTTVTSPQKMTEPHSATTKRRDNQVEGLDEKSPLPDVHSCAVENELTKGV